MSVFKFHGDSLESVHRHVGSSCRPSEYVRRIPRSITPDKSVQIHMATKLKENILFCLNKQLFP